MGIPDRFAYFLVKGGGVNHDPNHGSGLIGKGQYPVATAISPARDSILRFVDDYLTIDLLQEKKRNFDQILAATQRVGSDG